MGVAGNKVDLYTNEEVTDEEARAFAKKINASFYQTSAVLNNGIQELFREVGLKYLQKKFQIQAPNKQLEDKDDNISLSKQSHKKQKNDNNSGCCK